jgi:integrase
VPRLLNRLSARAVATLKTPGVYADGAGLYFRVKSPTSRSWVFVWHVRGKRRETGLGCPPAIGLGRARDRAQAVREMIADGIDPIAQRRANNAIPTFGQAADAFIEQRKSSVRSDKSVARWERSIGKGGYADRLRSLAVDKVTTADVLGVLKPVWETKASSAGLLRGYIETVLDIAKVSGNRRGDNPAVWGGHLEHLLPARQRLTRGHHAAMPYQEVPAHMTALRAMDLISARALEFTILTAARTSEALKADWEEFDLDQEIWTVPADRMKAGKEHRVPLSKAVVRLLVDIGLGQGFVFPSRSEGKPLSGMAMEMVIRRMQLDITVHGFRSSFRDWAGEETDAPREIAEAALAHTVGNSSQLAYRRGDALEKRRVLMEEWAAFCGAHASIGTKLEVAAETTARQTLSQGPLKSL